MHAADRGSGRRDGGGRRPYGSCTPQGPTATARLPLRAGQRLALGSAAAAAVRESETRPQQLPAARALPRRRDPEPGTAGAAGGTKASLGVASAASGLWEPAPVM